MIPESLTPIANHLWQSTLFAAAAGLLALLLRKNSARARHWIWVAASLKFLVPFSLLVALGSHVHWRKVPLPPAHLSMVMDQVGQSFQIPAVVSPAAKSALPGTNLLPVILAAVWTIGFLAIACSWWIRWGRIAVAVRAGSPVKVALPVRAVSSPSFLEPGVFGIFYPTLLLPEGIFERLAPEQWKSVIAHELCHVRHRDNLIGAVQMFVETLFWFHPLVWWIGKRIVDERERACDEEVLQKGSERCTYAQGILRICELYLESPLACVSGIGGANLRKRIEAIMSNPAPAGLSIFKKAALVGSVAASVMLPILFGLLNGPLLRAQSILTVPPGQEQPAFEVAAVKTLDRTPRSGQPDLSFVGTAGNPFKIAGNRVSIRGNLHSLIADAFAVKEYQVSGLPPWADSAVFDISAESPGATMPTQDQARLMLQSLLSARFQFKFHPDSKEMAVYHLIRNKPNKLFKQAEPDETFGWQLTPVPGGRLRSKATKESIGDFVRLVGVSADRPVIDQTGITGFIDYDITIEPQGSPRPPGGDNRAEEQNRTSMDDVNRAILVAIQDQLGLKLESARDKVDIVAVDHVEQPSEN